MNKTSAYKIQTKGNYPEGSIQHSEHGESLKSRTKKVHFNFYDILHSLYSQQYVSVAIAAIFELLLLL